VGDEYRLVIPGLAASLGFEVQLTWESGDERLVPTAWAADEDPWMHDEDAWKLATVEPGTVTLLLGITQEDGTTDSSGCCARCSTTTPRTDQARRRHCSPTSTKTTRTTRVKVRARRGRCRTSVRESLEAQPLDVTEIGAGLTFLEGMLAEAFDGDAARRYAPLYGRHLDAGLQVDQLLQSLSADIGQLGTALQSAIDDGDDLCDVVSDAAPGLQAALTAKASELYGEPAAGAFQLELTAPELCVTEDVADGASPAITADDTGPDEVALRLHIHTDTKYAPFQTELDIAIPASPFRVPDPPAKGVDNQALLDLQVVFGVSRAVGPVPPTGRR
jgi:hypothetical protein